jgi:DNA primase
VINLASAVYKTSTKEVIDILLKDFGLESKVVKNYSESTSKDKSTIKVLNDISFKFNQELSLNKTALDYIKTKRKLSNETIANFRIGYFNQSINIEKNEEDELKKVGFLNKYGSSIFYNRIMIPIFDESGDVCGFGGRIMTDNKEVAKYINSQESDIFKKSKLLFNFKNAIRERSENIVLVEGYMDVIKMHDCGFKSCVACLGTSVTDEQILKLKKTRKKLILALDNDEAGIQASVRFVNNCKEHIDSDFVPNFFDYSGIREKDCDEILSKNQSTKISSLIKNSIEINEFYFNYLASKHDIENPNQSSIIESEFLDFCNKIQDKILAKNYIFWLKNKLYQLKYSKKQSNKKPETSYNDIVFAIEVAIINRLEELHKIDFSTQDLLKDFSNSNRDKALSMLLEVDDFRDNDLEILKQKFLYIQSRINNKDGSSERKNLINTIKM